MPGKNRPGHNHIPFIGNYFFIPIRNTVNSASATIQFKSHVHLYVLYKMITLKEYEIYLKVKAFTEAEGCDEADIIPRLINGVGIIPAYVPLIIESDDMEPTKFYSLSAAARGCGLLKQMIVYACRNWCTRIVRRKGGSKVFRIEWLN